MVVEGGRVRLARRLIPVTIEDEVHFGGTIH